MSTTLDDIIFEAKSALRLTDTSDHDAEMDWLSEEAVRSFDSIDTYEDCVHVYETIPTNTLKLPKGFKQLLGFRFIDSISPTDTYLSPIPIPNNFRELWYVDFKWLNTCHITQAEITAAGAQPYVTVFKINKGHLVFNSNITDYYTKGELAYRGLAKDEEGRVLIKEEYKRGIKAYICWRFGQNYPERYPRDVRTEWMQEWKAQKGWVRGDAAVENARRNQWVIGNIMRHIKVNTY